jgi:hypothetical protein
MEGLLHGRGNLADNLRMLRTVGAKYIGRSICLWGGEANLLSHLEQVRQQLPQVHAADPEMIVEACIFEIVTTDVEQIPVPDWVFAALERPVEKRNFRYADIIYPEGPRKDQWGKGKSVPDVSRPETKLWFYFLATSYIDLGVEAIHFGQAEIMNGNAHVPSGGLVRNSKLLLDFHAFPLRIMEMPDQPQEAILKAGFSDGIYGRSKGGITYSGWTCEHLSYLVELDNWGASKHPGEPRMGGNWVWGYDEITWFAHQSKQNRSDWLHYAWNWVRKTDPNGYLEMPGSRTMRSPLDHRSWYYANIPSAEVPEGLGDEDTIRAIWVADGQ